MIAPIADDSLEISFCFLLFCLLCCFVPFRLCVCLSLRQRPPPLLTASFPFLFFVFLVDCLCWFFFSIFKHFFPFFFYLLWTKIWEFDLLRLVLIYRCFLKENNKQKIRNIVLFYNFTISYFLGQN